MSSSHTGPPSPRPARIEVIDASDDARLIGEALAAGELRPGFRENLGVLLWLLAFREDSVSGTQTSVGVVPTAGELDLTGLGIPDADLAALISIDPERWEAEIRSRTAHLDAFSGLPDEVWQAHRDMAAAIATTAC